MTLNNITLTYSGSVTADGLKIINRKHFDKEILFFIGKEVEITVCKKRKRRSNYQNRFYWGCVIPIIQSALHDVGIEKSKKETHEILKFKCNRIEDFNNKTGEIMESIGSTKVLTTSEFMDYISRIKNWSREYLNIELPEPGEVLQIEFK